MQVIPSVMSVSLWSIISMKIRIGSNSMGGFEYYNYTAYQSRGVLVNGINGSRKSSMLEELAKRFMTAELESGDIRPIVVVIDLESEFGRLRKTNPDIVVIGEDGEISLDVKIAEELGRQIRLQNVNTVIQLDSFQTESENELFLANFIKGMMLKEAKFPEICRPVVLILDEGQDWAGNGKTTLSREAIRMCVQRGRKFGILPIIAVQDVTELYVRIRSQLENRIIGYHKEEAQRKMSARIIGLGEKRAEEFLHLRNEPLGRFWCEGADISKTPVLIQLESQKHENKYEVPKISEAGLKKADKLRESLQHIPLSDNARLKNMISNLESQNYKLILNQMTEDNKQRIYQLGKIEGYKETATTYANMIAEIKKRSEKKTLIGKPTPIVVNVVHVDGKPILVLDD